MLAYYLALVADFQSSASVSIINRYNTLSILPEEKLRSLIPGATVFIQGPLSLIVRYYAFSKKDTMVVGGDFPYGSRYRISKNLVCFNPISEELCFNVAIDREKRYYIKFDGDRKEFWMRVTIK